MRSLSAIWTGRSGPRLGMAALACLSMALAAPVAAGPTLLVDGVSGRVIYAEAPDASWFPASLTKMMTAYIVFEQLKAGKLSPQTPVPLSEKARGQPATRIGLKVGIPLNVEQAVRGLILRSANDFAMAFAELIGGSEEGFAEMMNATAKRLGMSRSHFKNPHGLPDAEQHTTARDMAILAMAILRDFPEQADVFSTLQFVIHKGTFHTQNDLLRTLDGADGMKTGFTCGAGYNIVASATREGRRMIAVVMGEARREERSMRAAALLEHAFAVADWKNVLGAPKLTQLPYDPAVAQPVHDMSRETATRKCGNPVRRVRRPLVAQVPAAGAVPAGDGPTAAAQQRAPILRVAPGRASAGGPGG